MGDAQAGWRLVPRLLLRRAGFGFDLLDGLTDPAVSEPAARYRSTVRRRTRSTQAPASSPSTG